MNPKEAIGRIQEHIRIHSKKEPFTPYLDEAFNMAIEALKEMSVEEYRQRLMTVFHRTDHDELLTYVVMPKAEEFKSLEYILQKQPFEPRPHGEWNEDGTCSVCGEESSLDGFGLWDFTPYCPHCGADMRKEGDPE